MNNNTKNTLDEKLAVTKWYFHQHPMAFRLATEARHCIRQYAAGKTLDLGAGMLTWRKALITHGHGVQYTSLDLEKRHSGLDIVADVCSGTDLPDGEFDTIFCSQVLEHVPHPHVFLTEAYRLCRPGGHLILSTPFLFYLHGKPYDYFRYTPDGLATLAREAGFEIVECRGAGGLIAFLLMLPFTALLQVLGGLPLPLLLPLMITTPIWAFLDKMIDTSARFPASVILVANKK